MLVKCTLSYESFYHFIFTFLKAVIFKVLHISVLVKCDFY